MELHTDLIRNTGIYLLTHKKALIVLLFLLTILFRIPNIWAVNYSPDVAGYYDIAHSIKSGEGYITHYRMNYFHDISNITHHEYERPPLYPLFLAGVFLVNTSLAAGILANILLSGILVVLVYLFVEKLFGQRVGILSAILVMFNPWIYRVSVYPWTEPLFCIWLVLAFYFSVFAKDNKDWILSGFFIGLAFLTRQNGVIILVALLFWLIPKKQYVHSILLSISSFIAVLPWLARNYIVFGSPTYSTSNYVNYFIDFQDIIRLYPNMPTELQFPSNQIPMLIFNKFIHYMVGLKDTMMFSVLILFIFIGFLNYFKNKNIQPLIIFSILTVALFSLNWGSSGDLRHLVPIFIALIPIGAKTIYDFTRNETEFVGTIKKVFAVITILALMTLWCHADINITTNNLQNPRITEDSKEGYFWLINETTKGTILASTLPAETYFVTGMSTTRIPDVNETILEEFINMYNPSYFILNKRKRDWYRSEIVQSMWDMNETYTIGHKKLVLVYHSTKKDIIIYKVQQNYNKEVPND